MDPQMIATLGTVAAIFASAFGVFVAIDQLTWTTRQRRFAEFLDLASKSEPERSEQHKVLVSLRRDTVARLVGASAVPAWTMAGDAATIGGVAFGTYSVTPQIIQQPTPTDLGGWWGVLWPFLLLGVAGWMFLGSLIARIDERRRIADDFLAGKVPLEPRTDFGNRLTGGGPVLLTIILTIGVMTVCIGTAMAKSSVPVAALGLNWAWFGLIVIGGAITALQKHLARRRGHLWKHPEASAAKK